MSRDKQIEEMANDLAKICPDLVENCCGQVNCVTHLTLSLSKLGYRKSTDVAREIVDLLREVQNDLQARDEFREASAIRYTIGLIETKYESEGEK